MDNYGFRYNSTQPKQEGYFGPIPVPETGDVATEYSADVNIGGKNIQIPTIVPTLTSDELNSLLNAIKTNSRIPDDIFQKAVEHAKLRLSQGKSPFWKIPEKQVNIPKYEFNIFEDTTKFDPFQLNENK